MDVVLVSVDGMKELKNAYPNYFLDAGKFVVFLDTVEKKYDEMKNNKLSLLSQISNFLSLDDTH